MKKHRSFALQLAMLFACISSATGCGSMDSSPVLPNGPMTPEQEAKVRVEDTQVEDEESQGSMPKTS